MASDYEAICRENEQRYGTDIGRIGRMLLAERYDDRTHFIFELLQNAEDALAKRGAWSGRRRVTFRLTPERLICTHFGRPFDEADVRGVCGIAESTKDRASIGRFGIGFKSVYAFTERPEIHSGDEDFAIENFVLPKPVNRVERQDDETLIVLPLRQGDTKAQQELTAGRKRLGPGALLFLRQIDEIEWIADDGAHGIYRRSRPEVLGDHVRRITVIGEQSGRPEIDQNWLVFHRNVCANGTDPIGRVEIAFSLERSEDDPDRWQVVPVSSSPLVVVFPTVVETHLGFLVQGPFEVTPSRDNIRRDHPWNAQLVAQTSALLVDAMRWLRDNALWDVSALRCLPLDRSKFREGSMFEPLFAAVRRALRDEELLPRFGGGYVAASRAKLARTQELRELFNPHQLSRLLGTEDAAWLGEDITQDRAPEIRQYLMRELDVGEVTPETIVSRLSRDFLEAQSDAWIARLYAFLDGQRALMPRLETIPLVRLSDGRHVAARAHGRPQAFLPSEIETGFPTVREAVCASAEARAFLEKLGVAEPDPVDDVMFNILPKYGTNTIDVDDRRYEDDIRRISAAFATDSRERREKLAKALEGARFVRAVDAGKGTKRLAAPRDVYIATERLKLLFAGVPGVLIVDDSYACLRGEDVRALLEACGAARSLRPIEAPSGSLSWEQRAELRTRARQPQTSGITDRVEEWNLCGLEELLAHLPGLDREQRAARARLLWEALGDLEERRGGGVFEGKYTWSYYGRYEARFPSAFVRRLNEAEWVPDADGTLRRPELVTFAELGWEDDPFLLATIKFRPPVIDELAREAGIDPAAIDLLRKLGITSVAALTARLAIEEPRAEPEPPIDEEAPGVRAGKEVDGDAKAGPPAAAHGEKTTPDRPSAENARKADSDGAATGPEGVGADDGASGTGDGRGEGAAPTGPKVEARGVGRGFVSYVAVHPEEEEIDPDGLDRTARIALEDAAIAEIVASEPSLRRTPEGNPGFDLYETDSAGHPIRWVEVKAMKGSLEDRPVGLSRTQFECAREKGAAYWLYVVEHAGDPDRVRILRIQDPAGRAQTFTFDKGWRAIARTEPPHR